MLWCVEKMAFSAKVFLLTSRRRKKKQWQGNGLDPLPIELALGADGLHVPSPFAELQHRRRVRSQKERDDVDMNDGDSKVAATRMPGVRGVRVELVGNEGEVDSL